MRFLLAVHAILLIIYSVFRSITLVYNRPSFLFQADSSLSLRQAFRIGLLFDITVATYALFLPYLLLSIAWIWPPRNERIFRFVRLYCTAAIIISLIICAADIPYFNFFNSRLNTAAVAFKNLGQSFRYITREPKYYPFILISLVVIWGAGKVVKRLWNRPPSPAEFSVREKLTATGLASLLVLYGLWGGPKPKRPDMKSAIFSTDGFMNQLTLNPVQTWFDSYFDFNIYVSTLDESFRLVKKTLNISDEGRTITRNHDYPENAKKMNVVLVLMESMSADKMGIYGNSANLTPGLDSLAKRSIWFDQFFSNGIHTNAGIYSSLYSLPIMMMQHPMTNGKSEYVKFNGLPSTLKQSGYQTAFFCTHPKTFDNLDIFLMRNGYDLVSDQFDYPASEVTNSWGVSDESLFNHAYEHLDSVAKTPGGKPFFSTILTITAHPPFTIPTWTKFKPRSTNPVDITYEYADWSLSYFMKRCATAPWYKNTIFVFVGDHGVNLQSPIDVPLSYNHVPLIIHAPGVFKQPQQRHDLGNQTDIFPTIMGLIRQDYVQSTLGLDLFREKRPYAFFSQDHKMGVIDGEFLYVARKSGCESLYTYKTGTYTDVSQNYAARMDSMRNFACAHLQVAQWLIDEKKAQLKENE